jgi:hypothetical protein
VDSVLRLRVGISSALVVDLLGSARDGKVFNEGREYDLGHLSGVADSSLASESPSGQDPVVACTSSPLAFLPGFL